MEATGFQNRERTLDNSHLSFARTVVKQVMGRFKVPPHFFDEYLSAAYCGLIDAASRYDPASQVSFEKFAYLRVRGAVIDYLRKESGQSQREYQAAQLMQSVHFLGEDLRSTRVRFKSMDTDQALAQVLEFAAKGGLVFRLSSHECEEEIAEAIEAPCDQEERMILCEHSAGILDAIKNLPPKAQIIIRGFYFEGLSFQEIAEERLYVTRSWVSRMHSAALKLLREELTGETKLKVERKRFRKKRRTHVK